MEISIAAISPALSEIYINSAFNLDSDELRFVMAHEFLHRGWYLHQAAALVGGDAILNDVIERYFRGFSDDWFFDQLTSILYHFAANGSQSAENALYDKYDFMLKHMTRVNIKKRKRYHPDRDMFNSLCIWLTDLDSWGAFKTIVNDMSEKLLPMDADFFFDEWFYDNSKNKFGQKRVENYLQKQAKRSEAIKIYWEKAQEWDAHVYEKRPEPTLDDVIAGVDGERYRGRGLSMRFARNASPEDLDKLLQTALAEQDLQKRAELLWGLRKATTSISENIISELSKNENEDIRDTAFYIMENNSSPKMRDYALSPLQNGEDIINAISLLSVNIRPKDEQLFCDAVKSIPVKFSECDWHGTFMSAEDGIKNLRGKPKTDLLQYTYRETYCSCCRERIVGLMHKKKVLSDEILQECLYDCNLDIQAFAKRIAKRNL